MADPKRFFCKSLGMELGPMLMSDLINLVQSGEIGPDDPVREGEQGTWQPARELDKLATWFDSTADSGPSQTPQVASPSSDGNLEDTLGQAPSAVGGVDDSLSQAPADADGLDDILNQVQTGSGGTGNQAQADDDGLDAIFAESKPQVSDGSGDGLLSDAPAQDGAADQSAQQDTPADSMWYCQIAGSQYGPISEEVLAGWIKEKRVLGSNQIRFGTNGEWVSAESHATFVSLMSSAKQQPRPADKPTRVAQTPSDPVPDATTPKELEHAAAEPAVAAIDATSSDGAVEAPSESKSEPVEPTPPAPSPPAAAAAAGPTPPVFAQQKEKWSFKDLARMDVNDLGAVLAKPPVIIAIVIIAVVGIFSRSMLQTALMPSVASVHQKIKEAADQLRSLQAKDASVDQIQQFRETVLADVAETVRPYASVANTGEDLLRSNLYYLATETLDQITTMPPGAGRDETWLYIDRELLTTQYVLDGLSMEDASTRAFDEIKPDDTQP